MSRRYLIVLTAITLLTAIPLVSFSWFMNPYGLFQGPLVDGLNVIKPQLGFFERQIKTYRISSLKPVALVLGSSRPDVGLDPGHPGFSEPAYNLGLGQASTYTVYRYFLHADSFRELEQVVIGIDFELFRPGILEDPADQNLALAVDAQGNRDPNYFGLQTFQALTSADAIRDSLNVLRTNLNARNAREGSSYVSPIDAKGMMRPDSFGTANYRTRRGMFLASLEGFVDNWWAPVEEFTAFSGFDSEESVIYFREFLAAAYERGIDVQMVMSPTHAYLNEALAAAGLWEAMEKWKRMVVRVNEEEANRFNREAFPVWDFWGYHRVSTEAVPQERSRPNDMLGYWDPSHYRAEVGDMMLARAFGTDSPNPVPEGFGIRLNSSNIEERLAAVRAERQSYRETHSAEVAKIETVIQGYLTE